MSGVSGGVVPPGELCNRWSYDYSGLVERRELQPTSGLRSLSMQNMLCQWVFAKPVYHGDVHLRCIQLWENSEVAFLGRKQSKGASKSSQGAARVLSTKWTICV
ncbi:unnamed protein product [Microthlaspi erraticum]|uniref:Uncharacterized protein n=1 Tax=Microthlaspi erraticum TaxID=1685480 RepID=A0A6D2ICX6_9BRAS|nr:unnamed protein product [Microthlaspi erraticum]